MTMDDESPADGDRPETERSPERRRRTQRPEQPASPFPAPMTPSRN
jgi:hypothetical protein